MCYFQRNDLVENMPYKTAFLFLIIENQMIEIAISSMTLANNNPSKQNVMTGNFIHVRSPDRKSKPSFKPKPIKYNQKPVVTNCLLA